MIAILENLLGLILRFCLALGRADPPEQDEHDPYAMPVNLTYLEH